MASRQHLRRITIFFWIVAVLGIGQAVGAFVAAQNLADRPSAGVQLAVAVGVGLIGASTVAARSRFVRRPWRIDSAESIAVDYSIRVVVQVILALGAANVAYAGAILSGASWIVVIGLVFFVAPLVSVVPSRRNLVRLQAELDAQGCSFDLVDSLGSTDTV
jgi:hypothetical protein